MSANKYDTFTDVIQGFNGVFEGSEGLKSHSLVKAETKNNGLALQFECQGCGAPTEMLVEYPELVAMKYGVNPMIAFHNVRGILAEPTRWEYRPDEDSWRPDLKCTICGFFFPIRIARHECERHLAMARGRNFINPQGEARVSQICAAAANGGQAVRR